jgi:hypothetical protein
MGETSQSRLGTLARRVAAQRTADPWRFATLLTLAALLAGLVGLLLLAPKPWSAGVSPALALGADLKVADYVVTYGWWAALANALLLAVAISFQHRWLHTGPAPLVVELAPPGRRPSRSWLALVAAAVVAGSLLSWPRLGHSLSTDELMSVRRVVDGYWKARPDGSLRFREASWLDTLFYYRTPNNHVPFSVLSRASLSIWQRTHADSGIRFGESALRFPAWIAGAASIAAAAWLCWRAGFPAAGVLLAWLLAIHPWHVRYASEARGYSLLMFLVSAQAAALWAALHRGSWPRWLLFGALQGLMLWTYPLIGILVGVVNLCALTLLLALHGRRAGGQVLRWAVVNAACAAALLQLFAPLAAQVIGYTDKWEPERGTDLAYLGRVGSYLYLGKTFFLSRSPEDPYPQLYDISIGGVPPIHWVGIALALSAVALGALRLWRSGAAQRALALLLLLPGPLTWLVAWLGGVHLWDFYLIFTLPAWAALLALGASWPLAAPQPFARRGGLLLVVAGLLAFAVAGEPVRRYQRDHSVEPRRESVALTRPDPDPLSPAQAGVLTATFFRPADTYDPRVVHVGNPAELEALMARADREGLPLFVNIGWLRQAARQRPELMALVEDRERFERVADLRGLTPRFTRRVYRYRERVEAGAKERPGTSRRSGT